MNELRDEFLSEEDLDIRNLSSEELDAHWLLWLTQAQLTNDLDRGSYTSWTSCWRARSGAGS